MDRKRTQGLGGLVHSLQTLELLLRASLLEDEIAKGSSKPQNYNELVRGAIVPENAFTNWDTLRDLIQKYNEHPISKGLTIDETLVDIRDAIAHGRVFSSGPFGINQLVRFQKPKNNEVEVEFSVSMTDEWFNTQIIRFNGAIRKVAKVYKRQQAAK